MLERKNKFSMSEDAKKKRTTHAKKEKEIRDQRLTLVLTESEKEIIQSKADEEGRSQTKFILKFLTDQGLFE